MLLAHVGCNHAHESASRLPLGRKGITAMRKAIAITAIALIGPTAWAVCAIGDALEGFEDPFAWGDAE